MGAIDEGRHLVAVGRDPRRRRCSPTRRSRGSRTRGARASWTLGLATTPACFGLSTVTASTDYDAAVMLTAVAPTRFNRNGAKFFTKDGLGQDGRRRPSAPPPPRSARPRPAAHAIPRSARAAPLPSDIVEHAPFLPTYAEQLRALIAEGDAGSGARPLRGYRDCGTPGTAPAG